MMQLEQDAKAAWSNAKALRHAPDMAWRAGSFTTLAKLTRSRNPRIARIAMDALAAANEHALSLIRPVRADNQGEPS